MIQTDILIIGAGPCGLFTVFEAGLLKLRCHLIDALPQPGGQCAEIYPKKPIYDIPAYPSILAGELVDRLMEQAEPFQPGFTLGERAETIEKDDEDQFIVTTNRGTVHRAPIIAIAGGLGCFEPRKPPIANLSDYEDQGVEYIIKDPEFYRDKSILITGCTGFLAKIVLEKMIRDCQGFKKIYVMIRAKRGQTCKARLERDIFGSPILRQLFER